MNLLLLEDGDFIAADTVQLSGRRLKHLLEVHRVAVGDSLRVGCIGGLMGQGQVIQLDAQSATLEVSVDQPPPAKLPLTLIRRLAACAFAALAIYASYQALHFSGII